MIYDGDENEVIWYNDMHLFYSVDICRTNIFTQVIHCVNGVTNVICTFQLYSAKRFVEGYHIHIRDMSSKDPHFDVVTLSGGGTRSHTLSDLRPDTKYSIFLLPYYEQITGNPSNLKTVTTKEDGTKNIFNGIY